jgi:UDP-N-acetylglucosamine 2-epimerase
MKTIAVVISTRPDIIKSAMVIKEIQKRPNLELQLIHTGQHYDKDMSADFMEELGLPKPYIHLSMGTPLPDKQPESGLISWVIQGMHNVLATNNPDIVVVTGDTNSALAAAIAASKLKIPIAHIEAGCRSGDKTQTEEINRICVDHISTYNFPATWNCWLHLEGEGLNKNNPVFGHPLVDVIAEMKTVPIPFEFPGGFVYCTIHRRENIEDWKRLGQILKGLDHLSEKIFIFFPVHPHTRKKINAVPYKITDNKHVLLDAPYPYYTSLSYIKDAKAVITDSGGVQMEAAIMGTPCITMRDRTEWTETLGCGGNLLLFNPANLVTVFDSLGKKRPNKCKNIFGHIGASNRIVDYLEQHI